MNHNVYVKIEYVDIFIYEDVTYKEHLISFIHEIINNTFIKQSKAYINSLSQTQISKYIQSYETKLTQLHDNIESEFTTNINELINNKFDFTKQDNFLKHLKTITLPDIKATFNRTFCKPHQRKLSTQIFSNNVYKHYQQHMNTTSHIYTDILTLRRNCLL